MYLRYSNCSNFLSNKWLKTKKVLSTIDLVCWEELKLRLFERCRFKTSVVHVHAAIDRLKVWAATKVLMRKIGKSFKIDIVTFNNLMTGSTTPILVNCRQRFYKSFLIYKNLEEWLKIITMVKTMDIFLLKILKSKKSIWKCFIYYDLFDVIIYDIFFVIKSII